MEQKILNGVECLEIVLKEQKTQKYLLVCDSSYLYLSIRKYIDALPISHEVFSDFTSNPLYEDVCRGVALFNRESCDTIVAVGGGSAMDVAKCIKLYCRMDPKENYLAQECRDTGIPLIAIPTTAGTGSESTRYAVIYYEGKKQSVTHDSIRPNIAILDSSVLKTLPVYQKKCTMLDALCQGIESWWSVNSTDESKEYSRIAVEMVQKNMDAYVLDNDGEAARQVMLAANYAGRAINIAQTTAPHAMSYKLTSLYGLPHGHAVAVCLPEVWAYMLRSMEGCIDIRGEKYLRKVFMEIETCVGTPEDFRDLLKRLGIGYPISRAKQADVEILADSVNEIRLKNNPVQIPREQIREIYGRIVLV